MKTDVQIAQEAKMKPIKEVADYLGFPEEAIELYGNYKAKLNIHELKDYKDRPNGKLILVTAVPEQVTIIILFDAPSIS